jgi:GDP-4-dehydro-6-deoxy-D-mannose reductase
LEEPGAWRDKLCELRPAVIYHLAAQSSAGLSFADPLDTFASNVIGTVNLLEAVRGQSEADWPTILVTGSAEEYGAQGDRQVPLTERSPLNPVSPYAVSKVAQTLLCQQYHRSYELPIVVTRAFSHTGPHQDSRFVFPSFIEQIIAIERSEREPVLAVGNLTPWRDFLDVRDVIRAYRDLAANGVPGQIYNVGSGRALTIQEGLEILVAEARRPLEIRTDPERYRPADVPYLVGDVTKLRQQTGWRPERDIRDTLREMLALARKERK